ncbi:protein lifeguard 1 isoform X2 [Siniperca chuatsi]|uniref:protein lifeguard 1 isoform X2 n=1 Tax=Siniperca chuatsi TaxID=119488 RepID=UPI001CE08D51|nr:protein lifeguard 1 isoform X2 [Siniperca chuatsi]
MLSGSETLHHRLVEKTTPITKESSSHSTVWCWTIGLLSQTQLQPSRKVSSRMSGTADSLTSKETQDAPGYDVSSPAPSYSYQGQQPPPYSATPATYPPPKVDTTYTCQPTSGYESFRDICPEAPEDTTPLIASSSFDDKTVRRGFVKKVFSILTLQLLFTFSVVCVFTFSSVVKEAVQANLWAYLSSFIIFFVVATALNCCKSFSRRHPWNIVGLVVVTLSLSYMVGTVASFHNTTAVVITMGATLAISVAIIAFSAQTRYDFTICYGVLLILAVDIIMFGFFCTFYYSYITDVAYGCLGALLYSLFLMIDCQLLMGMMSYRLDPEEYINAALMIYLDIVLIFLYLLGRK